MRGRPDSGISRAGLLGVLALASMIGVLVYVLVRSRPETPGPVSIPDGAGQAPSSQPTVERAPAAAIKPRAVPESEPAESAASSRSSALEIEVIGPKGGPASNARLVLTRGKDVLGAATTDAQGLATLASGDGEAELLIVPEGAPRHDTTISIARGRRRIELPAGVSISGRVEVDGAPPKDAVRLWTECQGVQYVERSQAFWNALGGDMNPVCTTDGAGAFKIDGLKLGSEWQFGIRSVGYRLEEVLVDGKPVFAIPAPTTGVVISTKRVPVVRGRAVSGADHAPVPNAAMRVDLTWELGGMTRFDHTGADGRFAFAAAYDFERTTTIKKITLDLSGPAGLGKKTVVLDPAPEKDLDLGDIELPAGRKLRYETRDPAGTPVPNAFAGIDGGEVDLSTRTDADGKGTVPVPPDAKTLEIGALRYEITRIQPPELLQDVVRTVLQPAAGLEIVVHTKDAASPTGLRVRVSCDGPEMWSVPDLFGAHPVAVASGATRAEFGHRSDQHVEYVFAIGPESRVVVTGLRAGIAFSIAVIDPLAYEIATSHVTLSAGEWKTVDLRSAQVARSLRGVVHDVTGAPIADARVLVGTDEYVGSRCRSSGNSATKTVMTDSSGHFVLAGLYQAAMHMAVDKRGYITIVRKDFVMPAEGADLDFTLERGVTLTVKVFEAGGAPIPSLSLSVTTPGFPEWCQDNKAPGVYEFADLPKGATATILTQWASKIWTRTVKIEADTTETITMPAAGKIQIDYGAIEGEAFLVQLRAPGITEDMRPGWLFEAAAAGSPRTYFLQPVLPGDYEAAILQVRPRDDGSLAAPLVAVTVRANETTRITFKKP